MDAARQVAANIVKPDLRMDEAFPIKLFQGHGHACTTKVVTIKPPSRPHDGAFALGEAAEAPYEWVEIVKPVEGVSHARPEQSSETVKVAERVSSSA